ncbi:MAG: tetratricopeptide repeat protein [Chitinophagaceae bacterium]
MKKVTIIALLFFACKQLHSQSVDQGKKFFYYERYLSAREQFQKALDANPNNIDAAYWLGQTLIELDDSTAAKALYQKMLSTNGNAPLMLVGEGEIELMENKTSDARQHFIAAIGLTKNKDINVLNAIAKANIDAPYGDAAYALATLNSVANEKRDPRTAESFIRIGQAHRKMIDGGGAVTAFNKALTLDPKLAAAKYEIGRVYLTQNNPEYFLPAFEEAVQLDPNYAPAFYQLYDYWYTRDINKSKEFFNRYLAVSDVKPSNDYDRISLLYAAKNFQTSIDSAKIKVAQLGAQADPRYYKLIAYSYDELKDSANAKTYLDQYFAKQKADAFIPKDYSFRATLLSKFPGNEAEAFTNYQKAVELDTTAAGKQNLMAEAASLAGKSKNFVEQGNWLKKIYLMKKDPTNRDLYDLGYANYQAGNYVAADSIFCGVYTVKYPTEIFGYLWCARAAQAQDTSNEKGLAVEPNKRLIAYADTAREKYKTQLIAAHGYLASYYANVVKDKDSAVSQLKSIVELDSSNADAQKYIDILTKPAPTQRQASSSQAKKSTSTKSPAKKPSGKKKP